VRWGQAPISEQLLSAAREVFRPDLFDTALGRPDNGGDEEPADGVGAFTGPPFDAAWINLIALSGVS
jgi:two-component system, oxyanion-binding sensor